MMFGTKETFEYLECSKCGCLQLMDIPADMAKHYPDDYYSFSSLQVSKSDNFSLTGYLLKKRDCFNLTGKSVLGRFLSRIFPSTTVYALIGHLGMSKEIRILDVGCGNGELLYELNHFGYKNSLGIDPYVPDEISYENGLRIIKKTIDEIEGQFDFIMFNHSFEHMDNPLSVLKSVQGLLTKTGICMIRIPTVSSYAWKHYKENWVQIDAPRHFYLHSVKSLRDLCSKASLDLDEIIYDSNSYQFWGSEQHLRGIALTSEKSAYINPSASIFTKKDISQYQKMAVELNRKREGDMAAFFVHKTYSKESTQRTSH